MVSRDQHSPQSSGMPEGKTVPLTDKINEVGILQNRMGLSVYHPAKRETQLLCGLVGSLQGS